jgi:Fe-S cluster assembly ATP-binding protein
MLQMMLLEPRFALLDETDSGLDVDGIRIVAEGIAQIRTENPQMCVVVITHYIKFLDYLKPDVVCVMQKGSIVAQGGMELARKIEAKGFSAFGGGN